MKFRLILSLRPFALAGAALLLLAAGPCRATAQNLYVSEDDADTVSKYNASTGAVISSSFTYPGLTPEGLALSGNTLYVAGLQQYEVGAFNATTGAAAAGFTEISTGLNNSPFDVLVSGGSLYVSIASNSGSTVGTYSATTGAPINTSFITGLSTPAGMALLGTVLYVSNEGTGTIRTYDTLTGTLLNASFLSGFKRADYLTIAGTTLYVSDYTANTVQAFNALTGLALPTFTPITGLTTPEGVKVSGNTLYVAQSSSHEVSEYNATTGALINAGFITGPSYFYPSGLAISDVPEPSTWALLGVGAVGFATVVGRRKHSPVRARGA